MPQITATVEQFQMLFKSLKSSLKSPLKLNASATCLKMLVMRFADVQLPAPLSLHSM